MINGFMKKCISSWLDVMNTVALNVYCTKLTFGLILILRGLSDMACTPMVVGTHQGIQ